MHQNIQQTLMFLGIVIFGFAKKILRKLPIRFLFLCDVMELLQFLLVRVLQAVLILTSMQSALSLMTYSWRYRHSDNLCCSQHFQTLNLGLGEKLVQKLINVLTVRGTSKPTLIQNVFQKLYKPHSELGPSDHQIEREQGFVLALVRNSYFYLGYGV